MDDKASAEQFTENMGAKASEFASAAQAQVEDAADEVRQHVDRIADAVRDFLHQASESLGQPRELLDDLRGYARLHPAQALAGAVVVGFLAGQLIRRR